MRKLKFQLDRKSLEIIYTSFIRPLLEYSNVVWDNCTQYESNDLEKIQNEAARIVTGATKLTSLQSLYIETGWESLASRRQKSKLVHFYKMQNEMTPEYLSSLAPPTVGSTTRYRLRNESDLQTIPNPNNTITLFCPQLHEPGTDYLKKQKHRLLSPHSNTNLTKT